MQRLALTLMFLFATAGSAAAHTALMACFDEGDGTITCEGGFSDGSSAAGVEFRLEQNGKVLLQSRMNEFGEVNFKKPAGSFKAVFDAGEGHLIEIEGKNIM